MLFVWIPLPSSPAAMPPAPHSVANATSLPGRGESVQGDGFSGGDKVFGIAIRRPLGGAGCERSEQTEGELPAAPERALLPQKTTRKPVFQRTYVNKLEISKNCKIF